MTWIPPSATAQEHRNWPIESEGDWEYIGTSEEGRPVLYDHGSGHVYRGRVDENAEHLVPDDEPSWEPDPEETLGEILERIGKDVGWESLSEFARDHLEDDD